MKAFTIRGEWIASVHGGGEILRNIEFEGCHLEIL
jgi:hypothetical protein